MNREKQVQDERDYEQEDDAVSDHPRIANTLIF
jgi:hypothetical protein